MTALRCCSEGGTKPALYLMPLWLFIFLKPLIVGFTWIVDSYRLSLQFSSCLDLHGFANCRANWFARNHIHHLDSDRWQFELWEHSCTWATRCIAKLWPRVDLRYQRLLNLKATIFHKSQHARTQRKHFSCSRTLVPGPLAERCDSDTSSRAVKPCLAGYRAEPAVREANR